jgi:hypothetical protein
MILSSCIYYLSLDENLKKFYYKFSKFNIPAQLPIASGPPCYKCYPLLRGILYHDMGGIFPGTILEPSGTFRS